MKILILFLLTFPAFFFPQSWEVVGTMPNPVAGGQAVVVGSKIYILGGHKQDLEPGTDAIQEYNPSKNEWKNDNKMRTPRYDFIADKFSDSIVYFGGSLPQSKNSNEMEIWNLSTAPRVYDSNINFDRIYAAGHIVNGNFYIFGGEGSRVPYLVVYNFAKSKIIYADSSIFRVLPVQQMAAVLGSNIYLFGGSVGVLANAIYSYNTKNNTLKLTSGTLRKPRAAGVAVSVSDSSVYIIGGFDETNHALSTVEVIDIDNGNVSVNSGPPLKYPRIDPMVASYNGSLYVFGGLNDDGESIEQIEKLVVLTGITENKIIPSNFNLENNYPNPFNPSTTISYSIPQTSFVTIKVYDALGREVSTLVNDYKPAGNYTVQFTTSNNQLASGIYYYRMQAGNFVETKKFVLMK